MSAGGKSEPVTGGQQPGGLYQARPDMGPGVGFGVGLPNTGGTDPNFNIGYSAPTAQSQFGGSTIGQPLQTGAGQAANTGPLNAGPNMPAMPSTPGGKSSPKYDIFRDPYTQKFPGGPSQQPTNPAITNPNVSIGMPVQQPTNRFIPINAPGRVRLGQIRPGLRPGQNIVGF